MAAYIDYIKLLAIFTSAILWLLIAIGILRIPRLLRYFLIGLIGLVALSLFIIKYGPCDTRGVISCQEVWAMPFAYLIIGLLLSLFLVFPIIIYPAIFTVGIYSLAYEVFSRIKLNPVKSNAHLMASVSVPILAAFIFGKPYVNSYLRKLEINSQRIEAEKEKAEYQKTRALRSDAKKINHRTMNKSEKSGVDPKTELTAFLVFNSYIRNATQRERKRLIDDVNEEIEKFEEDVDMKIHKTMRRPIEKYLEDLKNKNIFIFTKSLSKIGKLNLDLSHVFIVPEGLEIPHGYINSNNLFDYNKKPICRAHACTAGWAALENYSKRKFKDD